MLRKFGTQISELRYQNPETKQFNFYKAKFFTCLIHLSEDRDRFWPGRGGDKTLQGQRSTGRLPARRD